MQPVREVAVIIDDLPHAADFRRKRAVCPLDPCSESGIPGFALLCLPMPHPLVLGLFATPSAAAAAAHALRTLGIDRTRVSIVARSHDEEGAVAESAGASPGSELEDSPTATRLGELSAHFLAAVALVLPGIGPIVADGPLASGLGEAAGHLAGDISRTLGRAGLPAAVADRIEAGVEHGQVLVGAHVTGGHVAAVRARLAEMGAADVIVGEWPD